MRGTWLAGAVVLAAVSLAACGQGSTSSSSAHSTSASSGLRVTPTSGRPTSVFTLKFVAPAATTPGAKSAISYTIGITGPAGGRCAGSRSLPVPFAQKGETVAVALGPSTLGGNWCVGAYRARVLELQRPVCAAGTACPQYVRVVAVIGTATFRVATA
ncbi:MAG TPA: hypothetical protein VGH56_09530 [Solirubrobacteraceae bacterium]